jgi:hypothetical protein
MPLPQSRNQSAVLSPAVERRTCSTMARYSIFAFCNHCGGVHQMGATATVDDGPSNRQSVAEIYKGKRVPAKLRFLLRSRVWCSETGKFIQDNDDQVFLVPLD